MNEIQKYYIFATMTQLQFIRTTNKCYFKLPGTSDFIRYI